MTIRSKNSIRRVFGNVLNDFEITTPEGVVSKKEFLAKGMIMTKGMFFKSMKILEKG